jgi:hypothetical protein
MRGSAWKIEDVLNFFGEKEDNLISLENGSQSEYFGKRENRQIILMNGRQQKV